jgi:RimJ/RimL family protein N-acetyltransferase
MFFVENNSKLVGMIGIRKGESPKTEHGAGIWGVFIRPEWRGLRIAEEMINLSCEWAKMRDVQIVRLAVVSTNESAIRLYERSGFTVYGTEPRALLYENEYHDEYLMSRLLTDA